MKIIRNAGIELTINNSRNRPNRDALISLLKDYDILIMGVFSKLTADMIKYVKTPKIIASLSVGLDHIDKSFFESNQFVIDGKGHRNNVHERPDDISEKTIGLIGCGNITNVIVTPHMAGISKQAIYRMDLELANKVIETINKLDKLLM